MLLSHEQTELSFHLVAPFPRNEAEHARIPGVRIQEAGKHLEYCGLARTVWSEKTDKLAFLNVKRNMVGGARFIVRRLTKPLTDPQSPRSFRYVRYTLVRPEVSITGIN